MIAITGATGQLGRLVIAALLERVPADHVVAIVRDPAKAADLAAIGITVRQGNYSQPETLVPALTGVEKLLLISSSEVGQRVPQHKAVIDAAKAAGVQLIAYTSILHADSSPVALAEEHRATEALLAASGVDYVLLRNGWYLENYGAAIGSAKDHGAIFGSAGQGLISAASRADYAEAAAVVLTSEGHAGKVYELAGDTAFTLAQLAEAIGQRIGKPVVYNDLPEPAYKDLLTQVGLPEPFAAILANSDVGVASGALEDNSGELHALIGRPSQTYTAWLDSVIA